MNQKGSRYKLGWVCCALVGAIVALTAVPAEAGDLSKEQQLVDKARMTWESFAASPVLRSELHDWLRVAKGIFIVPQAIKGAAGVGVAGGQGVLLVRDEKTGEWSYPAFYTARSLSVGFQIGGAVSEVVFVVRSQRGLEQFYGSQFKLGMNIGVAAGPMGGGMGLEGLTADLFVYARAKGAFVGTAVKGGHIAVADKANQAYYGRPVKPTDILVERTVSNPQAQELRTAMAEAMR
jgi:lipid-binding SYLF domain-containing protein